MFHTPTPRQVLPSSSTPQSNRRDSVTSELVAKPANVNMLKINNILNPVAADDDASRAATPADTAAYTATPTSATTPTPCPDTPLTPASTKQQKNGKDNGVVPSARPKSPVNYRAHELSSYTHYYDSEFRNELAAQHKAFRICTAGNGGHGLIGDFPKHVPYSSEKKGFYSKTGRDAFEVFQYKFFLPRDPDKKEYTVMWDYNIGLMRMTPFFKACGFQKTTPAKALRVNPGLIDLCHSITGGALAAQGYWVPFACARAICLTFCYDIRWALTPIFGPEFVGECLPPGHPNYKLFRIDPNIVRAAAQEAETWRMLASRSATPASRHSPATYGTGNDPRPLPPTSVPAYIPPQELHSKKRAPEFKLGSPFDHNSDQQHGYHRPAFHHGIDSDDEPVSPKSSPVSRTFPPATTAWTSINRSTTHHHESMPPPSPPNNTPVGASSTYNNRRALTDSPGFRNANGQRSTSPSHIPSQKKLDAARASSRKPPPRIARKRSLVDDSDNGDDFDSDNAVVSDSEVEPDPEASYGAHHRGLRSEMSLDSDDSDLVVTSPPPPPPPRSKVKVKVKVQKPKRPRPVRRAEEDDEDDEESEDESRVLNTKKLKGSRWTAADEEAARILMRLNREDARLAYLKP